VVILPYLGLDLTVFPLFSGAPGLGLRIGLQKVFANLISGYLLLADKSSKPGEVIEVKDTYSRLNFLGSRRALVLTRDGTLVLFLVTFLHENLLISTQKPISFAFLTIIIMGKNN